MCVKITLHPPMLGCLLFNIGYSRMIAVENVADHTSFFSVSDAFLLPMKWIIICETVSCSV